MTSSLVLTLSLGLLPQQVITVDQKETQVVETTLSAVRENPDAFLGVTVSVPVQFASLGTIHNPFFTRFVPSEYANFYAWADEQPIWQKPQYDDVFGQFFLSKSSKQLHELYQTRLYERVRLVGIVRNLFQGTPWIEVLELEKLSGAVTTATLAHLYRGEQFMNRRQWQRAISELRLVSSRDAPATVGYHKDKQLGLCYLRIGEAGAAVQHLRAARAVADGTTDLEIARLLATAESTPGLELDRTVNPTSIRDASRPLWEAFEEDDGFGATPR